MKELQHNRTFSFPVVLLFLVFVLVPVFYMKSLMDSSLHSRFVLLSVLGLVFFAITKIKLRWTWLDLLILLSYLWTALSITWARNFAEALFQAQKSFLILVVFLWLRHVLLAHKEGESVLYKALLLANIIVLSVAYVQLIKLPELNLVRVYDVVGLNSHKNLLASFLFLSLPFLTIGAMGPQGRICHHPVFLSEHAIDPTDQSRICSFGGICLGGILDLQKKRWAAQACRHMAIGARLCGTGLCK
jgi:hypothetical protein